jgi:nitrite reductase/ring-hydroxylating ferredoxin subunit
LAADFRKHASEDPYHYIRVAPNQDSLTHDWLIVGGEDHKTGQENDTYDRFINLRTWVRTTFPHVDSFEHQWSGQVWESADGLAFIGLNPGDKNIFIVTGDCGQGMTYGTIAGLMFNELLQDRPHPWKEIYDPSRMVFGSTMNYLKENINTAWQYTDYLKPSQSFDLRNLPLEEGVVIQDGLKKVAVYRNETGEFLELNAACPHLGGVVHWNSVEKSWDCPCHGSRFAANGQVINGPALSDLEIVDLLPPQLPSEETETALNLEDQKEAERRFILGAPQTI